MTASCPKVLSTFVGDGKIGTRIRIVANSMRITPNVKLTSTVFSVIDSNSALIDGHLGRIRIMVESRTLLVNGGGVDGRGGRVLSRLLFHVSTIGATRSGGCMLVGTPGSGLRSVVTILPNVGDPAIVPLTRSN